LELPQRIANADGRRFVVFFDEFHEVAAPRRPFGEPERLTKRMRAIFQRSPAVSFLFAGSIEHLMRDLFAAEEWALSQFGSFYREDGDAEGNLPEYWKIPLSAVLACEERRERGRELAAEWSRDLDAMGAPPE
jgi:hypothetical protein